MSAEGQEEAKRLHEVIEKLTRGWAKVAGSSKVVPAKDLGGGEAQAYNSRVFAFKDVPVPKFLVDKSDDTKTFKVQVHVSATLFDTSSKTFFGNTWASQKLDLKACSTRGSACKWNSMPALACSLELANSCSIFVLSSAKMASDVRLVLELVMTVVDPSGAIRGDEYGICWSAVPMATSRDAAKFAYPKDSKEAKISSAYSGTPRLLLFGSDEKALAKAKIDRAQVLHITMTHTELAKVAAGLMVENEQVGGAYLVPGLTNLESPKASPLVALVLKTVSLKVASGIEKRLQDHFESISGQKMRISGLTLQYGVHNGRRFIGGKDATKVAKLSGSGGSFAISGDIVVSNFVANSAVSIVFLVHATASIDGKESKVCIGWAPMSLCDSAKGDDGPVIVGEYKLHLRRSAPMLSVSNALVFADEGHEAPRLSVSVGTGAKVTVQPVNLKDRVTAAVKASMSDSSDDEHSPAKTAGKSMDAPPAKKTPPPPPGKAKAEAGSKEDLDTYTIVCDLSGLGQSGPKELSGLDMEGTFSDISKRLNKEFGEDVVMQYTSGDGKKVVVDAPEKYDDMLDMIDEDFHAAKKLAGKITVKVLPKDAAANKISPSKASPAKASPTKEAAPAPTKKDEPQASAEKPAEGAKAAGKDTSATTSEEAQAAVNEEDKKPDTGSKPSEENVKDDDKTPAEAPEKDAKKPEEPAEVAKKASRPALEEVTLVCDAKAVPGVKEHSVKIDKIPILWTWKEVQGKLKGAFGMEVSLQYADAKGKMLKVDAPPSWESMISEVEDDWEGAQELNGEIAVDVYPLEDPEPPEAKAPTKAAVPAAAKADLAPLGAIKSAPAPSSGLAPLLARPPLKAAEDPVKAPVKSVVEQHSANTECDKNGSSVNKENVSAPMPQHQEPAQRPADVVEEKPTPSRKRVSAQKAREAREQHEPRPKYPNRDVDTSVSYPHLPLSDCFSPLTRALKAKLLKTCISEVLPKFWEDVPYVDAGTEIEQVYPAADLPAHLIIVQFLAVQVPRRVHSVYFTFHFYHFEPLRTRIARVKREPGELDAPAILEDGGVQDGSEPSGLTITLTVDPEASSPEEAARFERYLDSKAMQVDVWDADTALQVGSVHVSLRGLRRKGREAVQTASQLQMLEAGAVASAVQLRSSDSGQPITHAFQGGVSGKAKGSTFVRLVNIGRESSGPPQIADDSMRKSVDPEVNKTGSRVRPLTEDHAVSAFRPTTEGGLTALGPDTHRKGLALLRAYRIPVEREIGRAGGNSHRLSSEELRDAIMSAKLDLTINQVERLCTYLSEESGGAIDIGALRMHAELLIAQSGYDEKTQSVLVQHAITILGTIVAKYGSAVRAYEMFAEDALSSAHFKALIDDVAKVSEISVSEMERVALLRLMGATLAGVPLARFESFFAVTLEGGAADTALNNKERAEKERKLARWRKVQDVRQFTEGGSKGVDERSMMIVAARLMREAHKADKIAGFLESCLTERVVVDPSFGAVSLFTHVLRNPFHDDRLVTVRFDDADLEMVTDQSEWGDIRRLMCLQNSVGDFRLASDPRSANFVLAPQQVVHVPFKLSNTSSAHVRASGEACAGSVGEVGGVHGGGMRARTVAVQVEAVSAEKGHKMPLSVLNVHVHPIPFAVDQVFRFYGAKGEWLQRRIVLDAANAQQGLGWRATPEQARTAAGEVPQSHKYVWTDDDDVIVATAPHAGDVSLQEVVVSYRCGEAGTSKTFHVVVYNEASRMSVFEIWRVTVVSAHCTEVQGLLGQETSCNITLRGRDKALPCRAYSSHFLELSVEVADSIDLGPQLNTVPIKYKPSQEGWKDYIVNFVHERALVSQWLVTARARLPAITKRYDIRVEYGRVSFKKIMYINPDGVDRTFSLVSSHPALLSFRTKPELCIPARGRQYINMKFSPGDRTTASGDVIDRTDVCVFINNEKGSNEECLCITVRAV